MSAGEKDLGGAAFGLIGRRLGHSWSPTIHELLGSAPYALLELEPDEVGPFVRDGAWRGLNVTIPYKTDAARLADVRSDAVEALGAANTLVRDEDGAIVAENTDVLGFLYLLESNGIDVTGKKVLVFGNGGACKAVLEALRRKEAGGYAADHPFRCGLCPDL